MTARRSILALGGLALLAVLLRLPYAGRALSPDEGGFLLVAGQWHPGRSLYGHYWVDRPPLLLALFRVGDLLAAHLGDHLGLRLVGAAAAAVTVAAVGLTVRSLAGGRPAVLASGVTLTLLVSPLAGAAQVNGELLAAPFIAAGTGFALAALRGRPWVGFAAGICAAAAVLVKQNMVDVVLFGAVAALVAWRMHGRSTTRPFTVAGWCLAGFVVTGILVLGLAARAGSAPGDVLWAMYPFRAEAVRVLGGSNVDVRSLRLRRVAEAELLSMGPLVLLAMGVAVVRRRRSARALIPAAAGVAALTAYGVFSVVAGGSYWLHYLVQLAVPTGLAAGLLAALVRPRVGLLLVAPALVAGALSWAVSVGQDPNPQGEVVGTAVRHVAAPGDTIVSVLGDPTVVQAAHLRSPYPYLWSLPARTLDPHLRDLRHEMNRSRRPTWVVARIPGGVSQLSQSADSPLDRHYHAVAGGCERRIYLRNDVIRPTPTITRRCIPASGGPLGGLFTDQDDLAP